MSIDLNAFQAAAGFSATALDSFLKYFVAGFALMCIAMAVILGMNLLQNADAESSFGFVFVLTGAAIMASLVVMFI